MKRKIVLILVSLALLVGGAFAQPSRGTVVIFPVIFDETGTDTSRAKTKDALYEVMRKGGFKVVDESTARSAWGRLGYRAPSPTRSPEVSQLVRLANNTKARYALTAQVHYRTRSIWVNLGPKTISSCDISVTIVDTTTGKVVYEQDASGRSDEKSDPLKVAGALLITPLVTAVSGGPKTPQETRAGQIAVAMALKDFVTVE